MNDVMHIYLAAVGQVEEGGIANQGIVEPLLEADLIVQLVLVVLVLMSVACWVIILNKYAQLKKAERRTQGFLETFWKSRRLDQVYDQVERFGGSPVAMVFKAGYIELSKLTSHSDEGTQGLLTGEDNLDRALRRAKTVERTHMERLTTFLATTGSTAPFIGLFGTVWGILRAFQKIGATGSASIQTVGPDIAHALIATAVGLAAAIPAVMAYNYFNRWVRVLDNEMENFSDDFLNIIKRHFREELSMGMSSGGDDRGMMAEINVTPFVDVMLVLLIIFMVTAPMMTIGMQVELPHAEAPPLPASDDQMVLSITAEGRYYIDKHEFTIDELGPKLAAIAKANPDQDVFLNADGEVPYEKVAQLMALCTNAGIPRMGMITQPGALQGK